MYGIFWDHKLPQQAADPLHIFQPLPRSCWVSLVYRALEVSPKLIEGDYMPDDEEDEGGAQHQCQHVAEGCKGEGHDGGRQPADGGAGKARADPQRKNCPLCRCPTPRPAAGSHRCPLLAMIPCVSARWVRQLPAWLLYPPHHTAATRSVLIPRSVRLAGVAPRSGFALVCKSSCNVHTN